MNYVDMPFYENNTESKKEQIMEQTGADEATVMALMNDWNEENIDIEALLQASNQTANSRADVVKLLHQQHPHLSVTSSSASGCNTSSATVNSNGSQMMNNMQDGSSMSRPVPVPTFASSANRPSVLDLTTSATVKYEANARHCNPNDMNNPHHASMQDNGGASPHHSPYMPNNSSGVFNYNNLPQDHSMMNQTGQHSPHHMMHSPVSPHHMTESPVSPHHSHMVQRTPISPHSRMSPMSPHGPISPHGLSSHSGSVSPHMHHHGPISPHMSHSGSVSPIPRQLSPAPSSQVFGRYAGSPLSMASTASTPDEDSKAFLNGAYGSCQVKRSRHGSMSSESSSKGSTVYKAKRERNNIAVRKSREKKKQREAETEAKVKLLSDENTRLQSKLDIMLKEMNLLKSLYKNIGVTLPQDARLKLENELAKLNH